MKFNQDVPKNLYRVHHSIALLTLKQKQNRIKQNKTKKKNYLMKKHFKINSNYCRVLVRDIVSLKRAADRTKNGSFRIITRNDLIIKHNIPLLFYHLKQ